MSFRLNILSFRSGTRCIGLAALLIAGSIIGPGVPRPAHAQPAPSFHTTCSQLRAALKKLKPSDEDLVVIQVEGALRDVHSDGALVYMLMCASPDPQVLCVTYSTSGRKAGDRVVFSGSYRQAGPDHVILDPCLHAPPDP